MDSPINVGIGSGGAMRMQKCDGHGCGRGADALILLVFSMLALFR
jgi:hypothetical protein